MEALIERVRAGAELSESEVAQACVALLDEGMGVEPRAEFLRALAAKGETPAEIAAFVRTLLGRAEPFPRAEGTTIDVCGTGGDKRGRLRALFSPSDAADAVAELIADRGRELEERSAQIRAAIEELEHREERARELHYRVEQILRDGAAELFGTEFGAGH